MALLKIQGYFQKSGGKWSIFLDHVIEELAREMDTAFIKDQKEGARRRVCEGKTREPRPSV